MSVWILKLHVCWNKQQKTFSCLCVKKLNYKELDLILSLCNWTMILHLSAVVERAFGQTKELILTKFVWYFLTMLNCCYRMICLVLVNSHLFPLPCGAGSTVPRKVDNLSVIILASLLICPLFGCRHSLLRLNNISRYSQVECTFSNIPTCEHLPVGGHYLVLLALKLTCHHINRRHFCFNIKSISVHPLLWKNVMLDFICMVFDGMWTTFR